MGRKRELEDFAGGLVAWGRDLKQLDDAKKEGKEEAEKETAEKEKKGGSKTRRLNLGRYGISV
jgi:hypothetical protein